MSYEMVRKQTKNYVFSYLLKIAIESRLNFVQIPLSNAAAAILSMENARMLMITMMIIIIMMMTIINITIHDDNGVVMVFDGNATANHSKSQK